MSNWRELMLIFCVYRHTAWPNFEIFDPLITVEIIMMMISERFFHWLVWNLEVSCEFNFKVYVMTVREIYSSAATLIELYYCSQEEYLTISVICFLWWLISGECFTHWNFGTQRPYQNYNNNNNNNVTNWFRWIKQTVNALYFSSDFGICMARGVDACFLAFIYGT